MIRYILFLFILFVVFKDNNKIEGIETQCCKDKISEVTRGFHNSSCVYVKDDSGENIPVGAPEPIRRCMKESDRDKSFNCDDVDSNCDDSTRSSCAGCDNICPDEELSDCVPTIRKSKDGYEDGGYCQNKTCSDKNEDDCRQSETCNWNGKICESKKFIYKDETKEELTKSVGTSLNYSNSEEYKKYANLKCNPFKGKSGGDLLGNTYKEGSDDGPFSDINPENLMPSWMIDVLLLLLASLIVFGIYLYKYKKSSFTSVFKDIKKFFSDGKNTIKNKIPTKGKGNVNLKKSSSTLGSPSTSSSSSSSSSNSSSTLSSST